VLRRRGIALARRVTLCPVLCRGKTSEPRCSAALAWAFERLAAAGADRGAVAAAMPLLCKRCSRSALDEQQRLR
jgi:hypothetical protein